MKKTLADLLRKIEEQQLSNEEGITDLNDMISKKMLKGGYDSHNHFCSGFNNSCENISCAGTTNNYCSNRSCFHA
jgi:hypothetical protein